MINSIVKFVTPDQVSGIKIPSPATGQVLSSSAALGANAFDYVGSNVAIQLTHGSIVSPVKGKIIDWQPNIAKVIIQTANKLRFLISLPLSYCDKYSLGIKPHIKVGQNVEVNDTLMTFDLFKLQQIEKHIYLIVALLDDKPFKSIYVPHKYVNAGEDIIFSLVPKSVIKNKEKT